MTMNLILLHNCIRLCTYNNLLFNMTNYNRHFNSFSEELHVPIVQARLFIILMFVCLFVGFGFDQFMNHSQLHAHSNF